jgi:hypothetical protein
MPDMSAKLDNREIDLAIRFSDFLPHSDAEAQAYGKFVERGGALLLVLRSSLRNDTKDDAVAGVFGIEFKEGRVNKEILWPKTTESQTWLGDTPDSLAQVRTMSHGKGKVVVLTTHLPLLPRVQTEVADKIFTYLAEHEQSGKLAEPDQPGKPVLREPADGAIMDNGSLDLADPIAWNFDWEDVPQASEYQLFVMGPGASIPAIDQQSLKDSAFERKTAGSYIAGRNLAGWRWKVRAKVNGKWGPWSEERIFDVRPPAASGEEEP